MNIIRLGEVCDFQGGSQPPKSEHIYEKKEGYVRFVQIRDFDSDNHETYVPISKRNKLCEREDILIARYGASVGKILSGLEGAYNVALIKTIPDTERLNKRYLYYYLNTKTIQTFIQVRAKRSAQEGVDPKELKKQFIYLPSLGEQKKIVEVLDKVQVLIEKRKRAIVKLDKLVRALFLDMFGDPVKNNRTWNVQVIGNVVNDIISGWSVGGEEREKKEGEIGVLKISAVTSGEFNSTKYKVIDKSIELKKVVLPKQGDILFSRANTRELVGACCIVDKDYLDLILPDKIWKIELDSELVNSIYFKHIISSEGIRNEISKNATGTSGSMLNISMQKFRNILIPVPPIEIQDEFSIIINKIEQEKQTMKQSLSQLEATFQSFLQQAFRGELKVNTQITA